MKQLFFIVLLCFAIDFANAQVAVNTDGSAPDPSAVLDVKSSNKGILVPRVTTVQRTTMIVNPAAGLLVFDTDKKTFWYYKSAVDGWKEVNGIGSELWSKNLNGDVYLSELVKLGIGTATPQSPLTLVVDDGGIGFSQESNNVKIGFYTAEDYAYLQTHTKTNLSFATANGTATMVLDTLGRLNLGDGSQAISELTVRGSAMIGDSISIGTYAVPAEKLDVFGKIKMRDGNQALGKVLTSSATGVGTWQLPSLALPYAGSVTAGTPSAFVINNNNGNSSSAGVFTNTLATNPTAALKGINNSGAVNAVGILGQANNSATGIAILGTTIDGTGLYAQSQTGKGVEGISFSSPGIGGYFEGQGAALALKTVGPLSLTGISEAAGKVLTSDAQGKATWQNAGLSLPYTGTANVSNAEAFTIQNNGSTTSSAGVFQNFTSTNTAAALQGISYATNGQGISGTAVTGTSAIGIRGSAGPGTGVKGDATTGVGVSGIANSSGGFAGTFSGFSGAAALKTYGPLSLTSIGEAAGKVLTSDAGGGATWQAIPVQAAAKFGALQTTQLTLTSNTTIALTFNNEKFDNANAFTGGIFTAPASGIYHFDVDVPGSISTMTSAGTIFLTLKVGGLPERQAIGVFSAGQYIPTTTISCDLSLTANQTVSVSVLQYNSTSQSATVISSDNSVNPYFSGHQVF